MKSIMNRCTALMSLVALCAPSLTSAEGDEVSANQAGRWQLDSHTYLSPVTRCQVATVAKLWPVPRCSSLIVVINDAPVGVNAIGGPDIPVSTVQAQQVLLTSHHLPTSSAVAQAISIQRMIETNAPERQAFMALTTAPSPTVTFNNEAVTLTDFASQYERTKADALQSISSRLTNARLTFAGAALFAIGSFGVIFTIRSGKKKLSSIA